MTFLCDERVDRPIVDALRSVGYEVTYVAELEPGIGDDRVLDLANRSDSILITLDKDFGELVFRQKAAMHGVLLLRFDGLTESEKQRTVVAAIREHGSEMAGAFSVVTSGKVRIRRPT